MFSNFKKSAVFPIMRKEFIHIVRDTRTLIIVFILPVVMLLLYGSSLKLDIKNIPFVVMDLDNKPQSQALINKFIGSRFFTLVERVDSIKEENKYILSQKARMAVNIDKDFSRNIIAGKNAELQIIVDGSDPNTAQVSLGYVNGIIQDFSKNITVKTLAKTGIHNAEELFPFQIEERVLYNPTLSSVNYFIPGIISTILMILAAMIISLVIVSEKTRGTIEQILASPIHPIELMLGKLLPYCVIGFCDVLLCLSVGTLVFKVPIKGNIFLLLIESIIFLCGVLGLGLLISTLAKRQEEAILVSAMATLLPSMLLSGFIFPIASMPYAIQLITYLIPARYFISIMRAIFLKGSGINYLWPDTLFLVVFAFGVITLSAKQFKKRLE